MGRLASAFVTTLVLGVWAAPVSAQTSTTSQPRPPARSDGTAQGGSSMAGIALDGKSPLIGPLAGRPGSGITISGSGFQPDARPVEIRLGGSSDPVVAAATVDGEGKFSRPVTIPSDASPGVVLISVTQASLDGAPRHEGKLALEILTPEAAAARTPDIEQEPRNQPSPLMLAAIAGVALVGGGAIIRRERKRSRTDAA